jgi:hypothetical protein
MLSSFVPHGLPTRAWAFSSHGVDATEPLTPLSRSPVHPHASFPFRGRCNLAGRPSFGRFRTGRRMRRPPRSPVAPARESWRLMNDLGCLPSVGALRRIRWPLQPQSRDLRTAFGDEEALDGDLSPPWVFCRTSPVFTGEADSRRTFRARRLPTVSPADLRPELGPRSLDPDRSFWSAFAELIRDQTSPTDFCNCVLRRAGNQTRALQSSQGRRPRPPSFSSRVTPSPLRKR